MIIQICVGSSCHLKGSQEIVELLEQAAEEQFMRKEHLQIWRVAQTTEEAVQLATSTPMWDTNVRRFAAV